MSCECFSTIPIQSSRVYYVYIFDESDSPLRLAGSNLCTRIFRLAFLDERITGGPVMHRCVAYIDWLIQIPGQKNISTLLSLRRIWSVHSTGT